ncbi:MAG: hypothetical protein H6978_13770 [Gammaproteobacteria bacterium]|nr:hypothetical protein [Gammaproteobacteria bacterium]
MTAHLFCALAERDYAGKVAPYRRFAVYQTWRAISPPPQDNVLAVCDGRSIPPDDAIVFLSVLGPASKPGTQFDARLCRYNASHRWYFLSAMTLDDLLVFKGFDSDAPDTLNAMHTAFTNPGAGAGASPRESIEARFFAFFD